MKTAILLGNKGTKRSVYFEHAARETGLHVLLLEWEEWRKNGFSTEEEAFIKIDPPLWDSSDLNQLKALAHSYKEDLAALEQTPLAVFLNRPSHILAMLDKRDCKEKLTNANISVTEALELPQIHSDDQNFHDRGKLLLEAMKGRRLSQVFIKPVYGSGAAGIAAFRCQFHTGRVALYTCALFDPVTKKLVNTKRLRCFTDPQEVLLLLDSLLSLDCIVEKWYSKAGHHGFSYDLRAVMQDNKLDFLLARLSKGPVTNLHLNNQPLDALELNLSEQVISDLTGLCQNAMACYPGLHSAGIDILLEKGSLKPRIIEMNGQGDLLYQDIYCHNRIYLHQAKLMKQWLEYGC